MAIFISIFIFVAMINFVRCLRFAYSSAKNLSGGGYPILGDAIHNGMLIGVAAWFSGLTHNFYTPFQAALGWSALGVFILNVWLILWLTKIGELHRKQMQIE